MSRTYCAGRCNPTLTPTTNRPPALKMLMSDTTAAAWSGVRLNMSCIIGEACARMPMPAVTLMNRMPQSR